MSGPRYCSVKPVSRLQNVGIAPTGTNACQVALGMIDLGVSGSNGWPPPLPAV